jgi:hypothetical protein
MDEKAHGAPGTKDGVAKTEPEPRSMHENVETWTDCCSCEPEPRWQALAEEIDSDRDGGNGAADKH